LKDATNLSLPGLYERIQKKKQDLGFTVTREQAAALLAAECGIDISKFLKPEELSELRRLPTQAPPIIRKVVHKQAMPQPKIIKFSSSLQIQDPLLSLKTANEAAEMSRIYEYIYVFENSVRDVIALVLDKKYGPNWWETQVGERVNDRVQKRINDEINNPWHGKRGSAPIFYTDINDLKSIIKNNWANFACLFPDQNWIETRIGEIERSRNIIAHNNPLAKRDIKRISVYFEDWEAQLKAVKDKI
jgi:hypothetical protein